MVGAALQLATSFLQQLTLQVQQALGTVVFFFLRVPILVKAVIQIPFYSFIHIYCSFLSV